MTHPDHTIPNGYKLTEVGVIPDDWEVKQLQESLRMSLSYGINAPAVAYSDNLPTYLRITDISEDGYFISNNKSSVNHPNSHNYFLEEGDLVFARTGASVGKSYLYRLSDGNLVFAGFLIRASLDTTKLIPEYLANWVRTQQYWDWVKFISMRSGQPGINSKEYSQLLIPLPPTLEEQRAIANALSEIDDQITALEESIAKKRELKQGAMQRLLTGEERLAGFSGTWEVKRLGEISNVFSGGTPSTTVSEYYNGNISWITSSDLNKGRIFSVGGRITELGLQNSSAKMINAHTLLIALYGATAGVVAISEIEAAINQAVLAIIPSNDNIEFIFYLLSKLKDSIVETYTQGGQPNLSGNIVKSIELTFPPLDEQQAIADVLSNMDAEINALEAERDKTITLKQGMMQELLTGKTRLI